MSFIFDTFLCHGGSISCSISGNRRHSSSLPNGGLELPCNYAFRSADKHLVQKARKHLEEELVDKEVRIKNKVTDGNKPTALAVIDPTPAMISTIVSPIASDSPTTNVSICITTVATTPSITFTAPYYITSEHSYVVKSINLSDITMIPSEVVSNDIQAHRAPCIVVENLLSAPYVPCLEAQ